MHRASLLLLLLGSLLVSVVALGQLQQLGTLPVSAIKPGMKGFGLSVFRGETPERFDVEVIDTLHNFRPNQDLILVRTLHPILERAITVAGMSGSPIYLDGKLIGAYAYGWTFGKEPVAGVTPIANMLAEIARPIDPRIWKSLGTLPIAGAIPNKPVGPSARLSGLPPYSGNEHADAFWALRAHAEHLGLPESRVNDRRTQLLPSATPLLVSGMSDLAVNVLGRELERFGLVPLQAGGGQSPKPAGAGPTKAPARFIDGGSVGVQMIRGDINASAIGTVTHVAGQRLVAFGHPMLNAGQVGLSTCNARVIHVLSSEMRSFKIAEIQEPHGTLIHDRQAAIVIDEQLRADMVPLTVRIHGAPAAPKTEWHMEVANQRMLTPSLAFGAIVSAISATSADSVDVVFKMKSRVEVEGHGVVEVDDFGFTPSGVGDAGSISRLRLFSVLAAAYGNPFEDARISKIDLDIDVSFERDVVNIVDAMVPSEDVDPGKDVNVYVTLRRFDRSEEVKIVPLHMPQSAAGESVEISVEAGDDVHLDQPKPSSLNDLLDVVRAGYPGTSLVLSTKLPAQGVKLRGQIVRALPGSMLDTLQPTNESDKGVTFASYERKELPYGHVLTGSAKVKVNVRQEPLR
ncbi:MAG TPA: hypothetical protein VF331_02620 [Polyangiales bacterium]